MLKRYMTFIVALLIVFGTVNISAENTKNYNDTLEYVNSDEFRFVKAFDLMPVCNYDDFQPQKTLNRAEFARIICAIAGEEPCEGGNEFVDIAGNEYQGYICAVNKMGAMVGVDKYTFLPDKEITVEQAVKVIVSLLGYDVLAQHKGGFPYGYILVATQLDLLDGLSVVGSTNATRGEITRILYNARNVALLDIESTSVDDATYKPSSDKTFLSHFLGVRYVRGLVTDNGITALREETAMKDPMIKIGGITYKVTSLSEMRDYIGRYVEAYYSIEDSTEPYDIVYIQKDKKYVTNEISFSIKNFTKLNGRTITYYKEKGKRQINLSATANIIYNGKAEKVITEDMFDYDYGTVTYIPEINGNSDTLIIDGFISWYIDSIDREMETIRTTKVSAPIDGKYTLSIPQKEIGSTILIEDEYGLCATFMDITRYCVVDICKNDNVLFIKIAPLEAKDGQVESITRDVMGETSVAFTDGEEVIISPYFANSSEFDIISNGNVYYIYKNSFGDVAALILEENASLKLGYMLAAHSQKPIGNIKQIKILNTDSEIEILNVEEKIQYSDTNNVTKRTKFSDVSESLNNYIGPFNYKINENGNVSLIYLPVDIGVEREMGRLGRIFTGDPGYKDNTMKNFGTDLICDINVPAFATYESETAETERYRYGVAHTVGFSDSDTISAYNYEPISLYADFITLTEASVADNGVGLDKHCVMIKKISKRTEFDGEDYVELEGYNLGSFKDVKFYISSDDMENVKDVVNYKSDYVLQKGDIVLIDTSASKAEIVEAVRILWRSDMDNIFDAERGRKGGIPGSLGYYDTTNYGRSNPFIAYSNSSAIINDQVRDICWTGYVYYVDSKGGLVVSTKDLSFGNIEDGWDNSKYFKIAITPNNGRYSFVTYKDGEIICREGTASDIKSYLMDGNDCSRIISLMHYAKSDRVIIINGEME